MYYVEPRQPSQPSAQASAAPVAALRQAAGRAIGVVCRPETEPPSHHFEAVLAEQFDARIWFEATSAVTQLGPDHPRGAPETYPSGP
jgi:erythromycin esterase-like protein